MHDNRNAHRFERAVGELRAMGGGGSGQARAADMRKIDARLLEHDAVLENAGFATTAFGACPRITAKRHAAVLRFERGAEAILQVQQPRAHGG
jgi:hypothetical protein